MDKVQISLDCPYCHTRNSAFSLFERHAKSKEPKTFQRHPSYLCQGTCYLVCRGCEGGVVATIAIWKEEAGSARVHDLIVVNYSPKPEDIKAPYGVPEPIASQYVAAVRILKEKISFRNAAEGFRYTIDRSLHILSPDTKGGTLYARIEKMTPEVGLTKSMCEWAHTIRLLGNDAAHEEDVITEKDANDLHYFTEMLLQYMFTLPRMMADRRNPS